MFEQERFRAQVFDQGASPRESARVGIVTMAMGWRDRDQSQNLRYREKELDR